MTWPRASWWKLGVARMKERGSADAGVQRGTAERPRERERALVASGSFSGAAGAGKRACTSGVSQRRRCCEHGGREVPAALAGSPRRQGGGFDSYRARRLGLGSVSACVPLMGRPGTRVDGSAGGTDAEVGDWRVRVMCGGGGRWEVTRLQLRVSGGRGCWAWATHEAELGRCAGPREGKN